MCCDVLVVFKVGMVEVLVVIDVVVCGLYIDVLDVVVNYELLCLVVDYVYCIGCMGWVGVVGVVVSFICVDSVENVESYFCFIEKC